MDNPDLLAVAMANYCRATLFESNHLELELPPSLQPRHLMWMCDRIEQHAEDWPATKLHRWIGFVQAGMLANRVINLAGAKVMFDDAKNAYGELTDDLIDHLNPANSFELDIGGEG